MIWSRHQPAQLLAWGIRFFLAAALTATQTRQLAALREKFAAFPALGTELVPQNSMLREFIGK